MRCPARWCSDTFDRYWRNFQTRRSDEAAGVRHGDGAYTPYEWRNVGAFVRLGERERALEAMAYFYADRRPAGWNQWAEVVLRDAREPRFLGDMPHGWVASDQIRSVLDLFAYEDEGERVAGAGGRRADGLARRARRSRCATCARPTAGCPGAAAPARAAGARVVDIQVVRPAHACRPAASCCAGRGRRRRA